ncbi:MAG: DNA mismatch repair protein MutS, partial [Planctomycetota bacterium]
RCGLAWLDISTGRLQACELDERELADELGRIRPAELLLAPGLLDSRPQLARELGDELKVSLTEREAWRFDHETAQRTLARHFRVKGLGGFGIEDSSPIVPAAGALMEYIAETQQAACEHVLRIEKISSSEHLVLDRATRSCLELVQTQRDGRREGTLLETLDDTNTAMGARLVREWLLHPLSDVARILERQRGVSELVDGTFLREELRELLTDVLDIERLVGRVATGRCNGRDMVALSRSLSVVPRLREKLHDPTSIILGRLYEELDPLDDVSSRVLGTLVDEPPMTIKEGGLVRDGVDAELDELREIAGDAKSWMARFQAEESERSSLPGLKIGFNSVFGYFIEVPRGQVDRVPDNYVRKQTVKNAERYITPELKEFEAKLVKAEELQQAIEYRIFQELREVIHGEVRRMLDTARAIAELDVLTGFAQVAAERRYVAPTVDDSDAMLITEGRHPVIELSSACESFVPNDAELNCSDRRLTILTGPNMAGKSTYIRQVALITLLAQVGSFVPAESAHLGVVDRIFTRVGSGDDIGRGESTFMVEMVEIANILNNASARSLVILDEVGRGTSTFDGLALAWAIAEHLHENSGCRTLFATHYHQLTDLSERYAGVANKTVAVREWGDEIVFLHKIIDGGTDRSYGIHVARLAGVPAEVIERARHILADLESDEDGLADRIIASAPATKVSPGPTGSESTAVVQLGLFGAAPSPVELALREIDPDRMTPIDALIELKRLRELLG